MAIDEKKISNSQVQSILGLKEDHFNDLKAIDIAPGKLTRTLSAFANADGGELYIGIDEDKKSKERTWRGFNNIEAANGHIQVFNELFPLDSSTSCCFLVNERYHGYVLKIDILKTRDIKNASDGVPYIRRGAQNLPVNSPEAYKRLEYDKGISSFEQETVSCNLDNVTNSNAIIEFLLNVIPTAEPDVL